MSLPVVCNAFVTDGSGVVCVHATATHAIMDKVRQQSIMNPMADGKS